MTIKKVDDINTIKEVLKEFDNEFNPSISSIVGSLSDYSAKIYKYAMTIVALDDNKIIGFASFYCNDTETNIAYLSQIAVKKEFRGLGISNMILESIEKISLDKGMKKLRLEVYNHNTNAIKFYQKNNFFFEDSASKNSRYMVKQLKR